MRTMPLSSSPLYKMVNPQSIAIFGASNRYGSMGTNLLNSIQALGFEGPIYPVHPKEKTVMHLKAYQSVQDLPETPDLAILVLPTKLVPEILGECGKKGIRHAIVVSGGFTEVGDEGKELQAEIIRIARQYGIRFLGPNCIGGVNPYHRFNATFLPYEQAPGFIGMASQSGSFITQMFDYLKRFGLGFSTGFSVGNEADIDLVDCLEYLGACPNTKVIGMYIETIRRGRDFIETARRIVAHKPIVAYYAGGSEAGRKASLSHTGALSGPDRLYDGVFRQSGVIRASSIEELFDFCWCLGTCPRPAGNRVIVQTNSGGPGAVAADVCSREGLVLNPLSEKTRQALSEYVPSTGSVNNPIDITFVRKNMDFFLTIPRILLADENADSLLVYLLMPDQSIHRAMEAHGIEGEKAVSEAKKFVDEQTKSVAALMREAAKPCIGFSFYTRANRFVKNLQDEGVAVLPSPSRAARALSAMVKYVERRNRMLQSTDWGCG
ncbi:MAG: CoA-binding protein [Desulfobacterales bacterium]|nr:CoA-binding protein [Desulfobacterales bacterium]